MKAARLRIHNEVQSEYTMSTVHHKICKTSNGERIIFSFAFCLETKKQQRHEALERVKGLWGRFLLWLSDWCVPSSFHSIPPPSSSSLSDWCVPSSFHSIHPLHHSKRARPGHRGPPSFLSFSFFFCSAPAICQMWHLTPSFSFSLFSLSSLSALTHGSVCVCVCVEVV